VCGLVGAVVGEGIPSPTLQQLRHYVINGSLRVLLIPVKPASNDSRITWIQTHCTILQKQPARHGIEFAFYECAPTVAA
jgi:hypothetical protein